MGYMQLLSQTAKNSWRGTKYGSMKDVKMLMWNSRWKRVSFGLILGQERAYFDFLLILSMHDLIE